MLDAKQRAEILIEALPYIREFSGKTIVIKYGGSAMIDEALKEAVVLDCILMRYVGVNVVLVHGGGKRITEIMKALNLEAKFVDGLRVTDKSTMEVSEMVLTGLVNQDIVRLINHNGGKAIGISGKDGKLLVATKLIHERAHEGIDYGFVGVIEQVNPEILNVLDKEGFIPVISPIAIGSDGNTFNINADTAASAIAAALHAEKLIEITDVPGICIDPRNPESLVSSINKAELDDLIKKNIISGGMLPKVKWSIAALEAGVKKVHIIDGRVPHSILLEMFTEQGVGTEIFL